MSLTDLPDFTRISTEMFSVEGGYFPPNTVDHNVVFNTALGVPQLADTINISTPTVPAGVNPQRYVLQAQLASSINNPVNWQARVDVDGVPFGFFGPDVGPNWWSASVYVTAGAHVVTFWVWTNTPPNLVGVTMENAVCGVGTRETAPDRLCYITDVAGKNQGGYRGIIYNKSQARVANYVLRVDNSLVEVFILTINLPVMGDNATGNQTFNPITLSSLDLYAYTSNVDSPAFVAGIQTKYVIMPTI